MTFGDGIRRNIAAVDPAERALLRDAFVQLNSRKYPGQRGDRVPGGVTIWFKQDEIHQATHVHDGPEFVPWHREIVNRLEASIREINPQLSLHYWDWTQDPRAIPNANLGDGTTGTLNLFTSDFMGFGGPIDQPIGEPWLGAGYYVPSISPDRDTSNNPADPPRIVRRSVGRFGTTPANAARDDAIVAEKDFAAMRVALQMVHNAMHTFVAMGDTHISFRDPFVFLLHSNVDRLYALWQTQPTRRERLDPSHVYGSESADPRLDANVEPWSTGHSFPFGVETFTRPWFAPEKEGVPHNYKHPSIVTPPRYDTNLSSFIRGVLLAGKFRTQFELNVMSHDDHRNTLIVELVNRTDQNVGHYQGMDDHSLAGAGAVMVFMREAHIRNDATLATMSDDDQRNTLIVEIAAATGLSGPQLQAMNNLDLVATGLGRGDSFIRGVLLAGTFRTQFELNSMSHDDHRNTLIVELVNRTNQNVGHYQGMDDRTLAGAGAVMVFMREAHIRNDATLTTMSDDDQRNTLIVEIAAATGLSGPQLQGMNNLDLVNAGLRDGPIGH